MTNQSLGATGKQFSRFPTRFPCPIVIEHPSGPTSLANQSLSPENNPKALTNHAPTCHSPTSSAQSETGAQGLLANQNPGVTRPKGRWPVGPSVFLPCPGLAMEPPGPALAGGVEPREAEPWEVEPRPSHLLTPSASAVARLSIQLSSRALTPACPAQKCSYHCDTLAAGEACAFQALLPLSLSMVQQIWVVRAVSWVSLPYLLHSCGGG